MHRWLRRTIFLAFIALFLFVAPLLVLSSMGYRYHMGKHRIERTGLLMVNGEPADAIVRMDDVIRASRLPARIGGLGENEYTVRVEREEFHPWEQRLAVRSGRTTFARDVLLFREATPALVLPGAMRAFTRSADRRWAAMVRDVGSFREVWLLDLRSQALALILRLPRERATDIRATWSPREAYLLLTVPHDTEHILLIDPERPTEPRDLRRILPDAPTAVMWELGSASSLIATIARRLHRVHLTTERAVPLMIPLPHGLFGVARNTVYVAEGVTLRALPTDGGAGRTLATLPNGGTIEAILDLQGTALTVAATEPRTLVMVTTTDGATTTRAGTALERSPQDPAVALWVHERSEVWAEHEDPPTPRLLQRRATPIVAATWSAEGRHVFIATNQEIAAVEVDGRTSRVVTPLATFDAITAIAPTVDGAALAIIGQRGHEEGVWVLPLR